jgi:hypothetical protein
MDDIELTQGDVVSQYEISLTFFTVVSQINNFNFSDSNLIHTHLRNEEKLRFKTMKKQNKYLEMWDVNIKDLLKEETKGPWISKCEL